MPAAGSVEGRRHEHLVRDDVRRVPFEYDGGTPNPPIAVGVKSLPQLDARFPDVTTMVQSGLSSCRGCGEDGKPMLRSSGFKGRTAPIRLIGKAIHDGETSQVTAADRRPLGPGGNPRR